MSESINQFSTKVFCKHCKNEIDVIGSLNSNFSFPAENECALALNPVKVGTVLTTQGNKKDVNFDIMCPKCKKFDNYQSLVDYD
nr:hypothetical protein [Lysinibacillus sphaericus]